jgi:hypothetical protein
MSLTIVDLFRSCLHLLPPTFLDIDRLSEDLVLGFKQHLFLGRSCWSDYSRMRCHFSLQSPSGISSAFTTTEHPTGAEAHHDLPQPLPNLVSFQLVPSCLVCKPTEHSRSKDNCQRMRVRQHDRHTTRIGEQLHHENVLGLPSRHKDGRDGVSFGVHLVNYVPRLEGDGFES